MDLRFAIPPDDFLANWLEADNRHVKHEVEPICYLSRKGRKARRIKNHQENYMFITEIGVNLDVNQFRPMISAYLKLDYDFELIKVDRNKFVLTLETQMPVDYACAVLEEARMIRLCSSNIVCYPTDEYAEGYFGGNLAYDVEDEVADMRIQIQLHALPLHLRTIKAIERILLRYCIVQNVDDDCLSSKRLECVTYACWAQRRTNFPRFIIIRVASKYSHDSALLSSVFQKHVQTYCVGIRVKLHGDQHRTPTYQLQNKASFAAAAGDNRVGYCFLRDVDVSGSRVTELQEPILLMPKQPYIHTTLENIVAALQSIAPSSNGKVVVQSIGIQGYVARSTGLPLSQLLRSTIGVSKEVNVCSQPFSWLPWTTSFGAIKESLPRKVNVRTTSLPEELLTPAVIEDLLSPFCMFDADGYDPGSSPDIDDYRTVVWTNQKRSIPSIIFLYAAPTFCETTIHPKGEVVELTVMHAFNTGSQLEVDD